MPEPAYDQRPEPWSEAASGYDTRFGGFTALYVDEALDLLGVGPGEKVLDVAAGSGVVTAGALARGAQVVATDFAVGMTAHIAANRADAGGSPPPVSVMDAQALAVADGAFDVSVSMFGSMFAPDPALGFGEMTRAVRPGGRVGVGTWDLAGFRLMGLTGEAIRRSLGGDRPAAPPTWAALGTVDGLASAMEGAGLEGVEVAVISRPWQFEDAEMFFLSGPEWSPPLQPLFDAIGPENLALVARAFADVVAESMDESGGVGIANDALMAVGRVPS